MTYLYLSNIFKIVCDSDTAEYTTTGPTCNYVRSFARLDTSKDSKQSSSFEI
jgi:hypothetical protein